MQLYGEAAVEASTNSTQKWKAMQTHDATPLMHALAVGELPAVIAFTGSGGKTTCSERLAMEASALGKRVIVTTTTKIRVPPHPFTPHSVEETRDALENADGPLFTGVVAADGKKMEGVPPQLLDAIIEARCADLVVIEADGSRSASIKGYRDDEPVLPTHLDRLCVVVGVDAVGAHRTSPLVHRPERLWPRLGLADDAFLTADDVARALLEQPTCLGGATRCATVVLINKVDDEGALERARALALALAPGLQERGVGKVLARGRAVAGEVAELWRRAPRREVGALLMAAGTSSRFGGLKQTAPLDGSPMIVASLRSLLAAPLHPVTVVLGHAHAEVEAAVRANVTDSRVRYVVNPRPSEGLSRSLATGVATMPVGDGIMIALGDMPWIAPDTIRRLLDAFADGDHDIIAPRHDGRRGHPVIFARRFTQALGRLEGDVGAAPLLRRFAADVHLLEVNDPGVLRDVDDPSALARFATPVAPARPPWLPSVVVRGGGDLASGAAWRLYRCGFPILVLETSHPLAIRRNVAFARAVFEGTCVVEGVEARRVGEPVLSYASYVPVLIDPDGRAIESLHPDVVVDARMTKTPNDTHIDMAPLVIGLGPGFSAGRDCHRVIETQRGHFLGRVIEHGPAQPDSGQPGRLGGHDVLRVLRAPRDGVFRAATALGHRVSAGDIIGTVDGETVITAITGTVRGLIAEGTPVRSGLKVGDVDPRATDEIDLEVISDKSRAIAGGVLEAILEWCRSRD